MGSKELKKKPSVVGDLAKAAFSLLILLVSRDARRELDHVFREGDEDA